MKIAKENALFVLPRIYLGLEISWIALRIEGTEINACKGIDNWL